MQVTKYSWRAILAGALLFSGKGWAQLKPMKFSLNEASNSLPHLSGKKENAGYPYVTAGDRLYTIGDQAGAFPAIGFHVEGQMGGVWQHPIKLLNGFQLSIREAAFGGASTLLNKCDSFVTHSFTSQFYYQLPQERLVITRTEFVPDHLPVLVVEYAIRNQAPVDRELTLTLTADVNIMPTWLGERSGMIDSTDHLVGFDQGRTTAFFKDDNNPWYAGISTSDRKTRFTGTQSSSYKGKGIAGNLETMVHLSKGGTTIVRFYIAGSLKDTSEITNHITLAKQRLSQLFADKQQRYQQLAEQAVIDIPDTAMMQAYRWGKYTSDWLVRDVPGLGRGMSAGLPDYPWFFSNDQAYTFHALVGTVQPDIFYRSWKMLQALSDKANGHSGRVIHEASTNGAVYDNGRMEESQLHIMAAWTIYKWTGNRAFLEENYAHGNHIWQWLQQHDTDHNGYIEGYGGVEIEGLNAEMLDVQVRTQEFLEVMGQMAQSLGKAAEATAFQQKAAALAKKINADWWIPSENRYADFISSREKAIAIIDTALAKRTSPNRNQWAIKKLSALRASILDGSYKDKGYVVYYNTAGLLPLEAGMADTAKALTALQHISFFSNRFGLYITGIERPDDLRIDEGSFRKDREFNYGRAVMPAATAGLAIAACRYGNTDLALEYIHKILNSFNYATPGTTYEVSPDYGMFVQAWNIRALNIPIIHYFFGIDPDAGKKIIHITPHMPEQWDHASIKNVLVGNTRISVVYKKVNGVPEYKLYSTEKGWKLNICKRVFY